MEFDDGLDDDPSSFRTPPPPDDRLWRHPSEMRPKRSVGERTWLVASISGMVGALLASAVVVAAGGLAGRDTERVVERQEVPIPTVSTAGGPSVTVGVVSALHRRLDTRSGPPLLDMIQTDAPISPGSSGGALLDASGAVIGLTTAVATTDGAQGLGFATPIDVARSSADQLIAGGKVVHVWLGIEGTDVDPTTAKDMAIDGGALVGRVVKGSPADKGGLQARDVIVGVDNQPVKTMGGLVVALRSRSPGSTVALDVRRGKEQRRMTVGLIERPNNPG